MLSRILAIVGLAVMLIGLLDPLEGSVVILPGVGIAALGALVGHSRFARLLCCALALVAVGVAAMFAVSAVGGLGHGREYLVWWGLVVALYPIGFLLALVMAILRVIEAFRRSVPLQTT
jgi:hypothetical protein